ncbi:condensin complex subunit 2/barren [Multifurca ochricompacta]|uniref:Condensin complex subunit 2 n=1 Tax=Multifurca ochricompacta TaxID=376703 RepID=A0AAD4QRA2_9AGAM|nr:condensin complex subunit 2/barren [Multifurca ochricompacta]
MAPSRPTRHHQARLPLYADGSSSESDRDQTPRQRGKSQAIRKRISDIQDKSFTDDGLPGRVPLKAVNINDDSAEKRRRRRSAKNTINDNLDAGLSTGGRQDDTEDGGTHTHSRHKQALKSIIVETPIIDVPIDVRNSNYEEWMKMAMDNKINQANSWNFALIDYFHDMSLLRNNVDNSINFQRASSTLDGCVKIWTSRVDSVGTETGKLLSNLASDGRDADDEEPISDNPDSQEPSQKKRKATHRSESTLAKNAAQLKSKKLDLEFSVDPLFRKTCEDFDEGGAHGLLMNHLGLGVGSEGALRVIFDASDSMGRVGEDEDLLEHEDDIDLAALRCENISPHSIAPHLVGTGDFLPDLEILERKAISHSLEGFSFSRDTWVLDEAALFREDTPLVQDDGVDEAHSFEPGPIGDFAEASHNTLPEEDFFMGDQAVGNDLGGDDLGPGVYGGDDGENGSVEAQGDLRHTVTDGVRLAPFDPRRAPNERALIMAMTDADGEGGMLDYFDQSVLKNWAGPEHWKLRKAVRRPEATEASAASKPKREKKEAFKIDFLSPAEKDLKDTAKELFAPVTRGTGVTLPKHPSGRVLKGKKGRVKEKQNDHTLPDDMHFSSRQLITLFLKPKFSLKMRGQRASLNENGDGEVDENFWAQAAADQAAGRAASDVDEAGDGSGIPFNTQFFHDDYDDGPGFDDGFDGDLAETANPGEQDLLAETQGKTRRVRPEFVNYSKRAKRVDVRKLKENIWRGLKITPEQQPSDGEAMDIDKNTLEITDPDEARTFDEVIVGLQSSYPEDKLAEISTSFCFICLLHLANERGLKLETGEITSSTASEVEEGDKVGNIWGLKVYRDSNATPAA